MKRVEGSRDEVREGTGDQIIQGLRGYCKVFGLHTDRKAVEAA